MAVTACTITYIEPKHNPNEGRNIINNNFDCLNANIYALEVASATGATTVSSGTNISSILSYSISGVPNYHISVIDTPIFTSVSANTYSSGGTSLETIIANIAGVGSTLWSSSTGVNSIIASNGSENLSSGNFSFASGFKNSATGATSFIGGGSGNTTSGHISFVGGGQNNLASGTGSVVIGGTSNTASGDYSSVIGGSGNTASGLRTVVIGGSLISGSSNDTVYVPNLNIQTNLSFSGSATGSTLKLTTTNVAAPLNLPIFSFNPTLLVEGDTWLVVSGSSIYLNVQHSGAIKTVELT